MSRKTGRLNHTHKYYKKIVGYGPKKKNAHPTKVWTCALRPCTHNLPTFMRDPVGFSSYCWSCGGLLELTARSLLSDYPCHEGCPPYEDEIDMIDGDLPVYK